MGSAVALLAVLVTVGWVALRDPGTSARLAPREQAPDPVSERDDRVAALVGELERVVAGGQAPGASGLVAGDDRAGRELRRLAGTVRALDLAVLELRFVSSSSLPDSARARWGPDAFVADVDLTWQVVGLDDQVSNVEVPVVVRDDGSTTTFVTARTPSARVPTWWNDRVAVERPDGRTLIVAARGARVDGPGGDLGPLARQGARTVRSALPSWDGRAVIEAPATAGRFAQASGLTRPEARGIAAVTTSSDGSLDRDAPQRVFLNPDVFGDLDETGRRIVLAHELTHVAVDGASSAMPLWLSEGYADYVALRRSAIPPRVLAAQIRRLVRDEGAPQTLPRGGRFDGTDPDVGAWYEAAWLAARLLARTHGEPALHAFYRRADRDGGTDRAFARLGTTERAFTRAWRAELERLAQ